MHEILLSFVGNRDPYVDGSGAQAAAGGTEPELGPVLSLLQAREFTRVVLFCTGSSYVERARMVQETVEAESAGIKFNFVSIDLESPIDYEEIYRELRRSVDLLLSSIEHLPHRLSILLDPGTPQMQTAWFLLVASGYVTADLLQGVPPRFAGGAYKVRTVDMSRDIFPGLTIGVREGPPGDIKPGPHPAGSADFEDPEGHWIRSSTPQIIGSSPAFQAVMDQALKVAPYDISVVVRGETGTGKEVVARLIHDSSRRAGKPFVAVNCAAINPNLAESEFFGHEKGAFTGADRNRLGQFRAADGGTVFLDEIGDLPLEIQAKLLRVLEDNTLVPVGGDTSVSVDVRIIAATNRDLDALVAQATFRRDLYERLAQVTVSIPPLRDRSEDIPLLLHHFIEKWNRKYDESKGFGEEAFSFLMEYPWPGNVRELQNTVSATCAMGRSSAIGPELLPAAVLRHFNRDRSIAGVPSEIPEDGMDIKAVFHNLEKSYYEEAIKRAGGNAEQAARLLGLNGAAFRKAARERLGVTYREAE